MANYSVEPNPNITFRVRFEDEHYIMVVKPTGVVTVPGKGNEGASLLNGLFARMGDQLQNLGKSRDFGMLHRLDKATSGLVLIAKTASAYEAMRTLFEQRALAKYYWAITKNAPKKPKGVINRPILEYTAKAPSGIDTKNKKLSRIAASGKPAVTAYRVLASAPGGALVECRAVTGRLHQVRVHLDSIGCVILGDDLYAPTAIREAAPRLALHAHRMAFTHPFTGAKVDIATGWPQDLKGVLKRLGLPKPTDLPGPTGPQPAKPSEPLTPDDE
jgi:23S rRNA pseudouridine1911/1915/1917 synthase